MVEKLQVKDLVCLFDGPQRDSFLNLLEKNSLALNIEMVPFENSHLSNGFWFYLEKSDLKEQLLKNLLSPESSLWLQQVKKLSKIYLSYYDASWKMKKHLYPTKQIVLKLVLVGENELPTIEINVEHK